MIRLEGVTKRFGTLAAVDDLSLEVRPGEIFGCLGPNGAGKTTTIKLCTGLLAPSAGCIFIGDVDLAAEPERAKRLIGLVPDTPVVYPKLTGREFLSLVGDLYGVPAEAQARRIPDLLARFELEEHADELTEGYSRGMLQKLVVCAAVLHEPRALFLDEPIVGLDPRAARTLKDLLQDLAKSGVAIFLSTHILEIAEQLCTRVAILQRGRVIAGGTPEEIRQRAGGAGGADRGLEAAFLDITESGGVG